MALTAPEPVPAAEPSERGLPLPSLRIRGYRLFEDLRLQRLGRVNLITGKNNTGKTALLEAIRIWMEGAAPSVLLEVIESRRDRKNSAHQNVQTRQTWGDLGIYSLLNGHPNSLTDAHLATIGTRERDLGRIIISIADPTDVELDVEDRWFWDAAAGPREFEASTRKEELWILRSSAKAALCESKRWKRVSQFLDDAIQEIPALQFGGFVTQYVAPAGVGTTQMAQLWDRVSLTPDEDEVVRVIQLLAPRVERVTLRAMGEGGSRVPFVRVRGIKDPIPLARMGDGVGRAFGLGLALVNARNGCLLLDEAENGIHYSVQADLWRMIFATAQRLNVQVFATTHSYDCIRGFQQAASENTEVEGMLIRLLEHEGKIVPTEFNERDLEIVTRRNLEVR